MSEQVDWRSLADWPETQRPGRVLWSLLAEKRSLTDRLRELCGAGLRVEPRRLTPLVATPEQAGLLGLAPGCDIDERRVTLNCGATPWVFALSIAARGRLADLGCRPLGDRLFPGGAAERGPIEAARLRADDALYRAASSYCAEPPPIIWARRSVIALAEARYLVHECFIGGVA